MLQKFFKLLGFRNDDTPEAQLERHDKLNREQKDAVKEAYLNQNFERGSVDQYSQLGLKLWRSGQPKEALEHYNQAVALDPQNATLLVNRANLQLELGHFDEGMRDFENAQLGRPKLPDYMFSALTLWQTMSPEARQAWIKRRQTTNLHKPTA